MKSMHEVLHGIAIKKHADRAAIQSLTGLDGEVVGAALAHAVATGRAIDVEGSYLLSAAGHLILESQYDLRYASMRANAALIDAYEQFETVNRDLKQAITDWQMMSVGGKQVANDHSDADYDAGILDRIGAIHERVEPLLAVFATAAHRFQIYSSKLESALEQAEDGAREWVSDAKIESYHTVWFEMHEDLLRMLGRQREE